MFDFQFKMFKFFEQNLAVKMSSTAGSSTSLRAWLNHWEPHFAPMSSKGVNFFQIDVNFLTRNVSFFGQMADQMSTFFRWMSNFFRQKLTFSGVFSVFMRITQLS